jgi:RecJ-like exonuclease
MDYERRGDDQIRAAFALGGEAEYYQPKDPGPECSWCDGGGTVDVVSIVDVSGNIHQLNQDIFQSRQHEIPCPRCIEHPGVEPVPERGER